MPNRSEPVPALSAAPRIAEQHAEIIFTMSNLGEIFAEKLKMAAASPSRRTWITFALSGWNLSVEA